MILEMSVSQPVRAHSLTRADRDGALRDLYEEHYRSLVRLACLLLDDRGLGEEVVQEAFIKLHGAWHRIDDLGTAPAYLRSIVLNLSRSRMRHRQVVERHKPTSVPEPTSPADAAVLREDQREVLDALRSLPRRQRECLALRYYQDLSEAEIAETLGISKGSVKSHSSRGMAALTKKLEALA